MCQDCVARTSPDVAPEAAGLSRRQVLQLGLGLGAATLMVGCGVTPGPPTPAATLAPEAVGGVQIAGCATWGARPPSQPVTVLDARPTRIIVHHTSDPNTTDLSRDHAYALARSIQRYHQDSNGWIDSGQHFTISRGGFVMEGRHRSLEALTAGRQQVRGAHCPGQNDVAVGIENEGNYMTAAPPAAQYNQLVQLCAQVCRQYGIAPDQIFGHRDFYSTDCPGDVLYAKLPQLRRDVAAALGQATTPNWPTLQSGAKGAVVKSAQFLLRARGQTLDPDGQFGSATEAAVRAFQSGQGLNPDGILGEGTWPALVVTTHEGDRGDAVSAVQVALANRGQNVTADGQFGPQTVAAVRAIQTASGLEKDGVVGPETWHALVG